MPNPELETPLVVFRKKAPGPQQHRGAWKVALADFVTAMMALFMVLWLMNTDSATRLAIGAYFNNPSGESAGLGPGAGEAGSVSLTKDQLETLASEIRKALESAPDLSALQDHVTIAVNTDGLRIELLEDEGGTFFETGRAQPTKQGREALDLIGQELLKLPNSLVIEGHTDARPYRAADGYSNWELSTDRANGARRFLTASGFPPERIVEVRGFADNRLRRQDDPRDPSNRRISLIVKYGDK